MNNTFNLNRFGLLIKRQWLDFGKVYLMSIVVLAAVIALFYYKNMPSLEQSNNIRWENNEHAQLGFRLIIFIIIGILFISIQASYYFSLLGQKSRAIMELMTPASVTEKFLSSIFFTVVVSFLSFLIVFYAVDKIFVNHFNTVWQNQQTLNDYTNKLTTVVFSNLFDDLTTTKEFKFLFATPFLINSIFLLGSVYFNRFHYIKTALAVTTFIALIFFITYKVGSWLMKNTLVSNNNYGNSGESFILTTFLITSILLTLIIWAITFVRLKEKEV